MPPVPAKLIRRCRPLRREDDSHLWFVTTRVLEERFLLHPILTCGAKPVNRKARKACKAQEKHCEKRLLQLTARANRRRHPGMPAFTVEHLKMLAQHLVMSALGRAQQKYDTEVFSLVVMSNHLHLVCKTNGKNLARFMGFFKARLTQNINMLTGRRGPLWARRYDAQAIVDDEGTADRMGYTVNNPTAANLVDDPELWPGLNLAYGMGDADTFEPVYFDRTAWHRNKRPKDLAPFFKTTTLTLSPVPSCEGMSREVYYQSLRTWIGEAHAKVEAKRADKQDDAPYPRKAKTLGAAKVLQASFDQRPKHPSRKRRPYTFGRAANVREHNHGMLRAIAGFNDSADRLRAGQLDVEFPEGTYRPPLMSAT